MHDWGDDTFDWKGLSNAISLIYFWGKKVGRNGGDLKEKWGTVRWSCGPGKPYKLYNITHPGYCGYWWNSEDKPLMNIIDNMSISYIRFIGPLVYLWRKFFYAYAYHRAVKTHPALYKEILCHCDCPELLFKKEFALYDSLWVKKDNNVWELKVD